MFQPVNFKTYSENRKMFYNKLENFSIDISKISAPIIIDENFFSVMKENFSAEMERRSEVKKFSREENTEYKKKLKRLFPQMLPVFEHKGPAVYGFKINYINGIDNDQILNHYLTVRKDRMGWWTKATIQRLGLKTDILYIGKVETALENRFIQHVGLGHKDTAGLKLYYWLPLLKGITLSYQFLPLEKDMTRYVEDIEKVLWDECKPLLGAAPRF